MKIKLARYAGFCMGVRRALSLCMDLVRSGKGPIYTLGPIIHNNIVTGKLESFGVRSVDDINKIEPKSYVIVRSHGITPKLRQELIKKGLNICDATCPKVARVQSIIKSNFNQGYSIVIIGDHGHAETQGLLGYADDKGTVLQTMQEAETFMCTVPRTTKVCVVAQTTQEPKVFQEFCRKLESYFDNIKIIDTICDATRKRQEEVGKNASCYDCIIVAGGKNSANTIRLYETALGSSKKAFHIESPGDLDGITLDNENNILVTAGASTPLWIIHQIKEKIGKGNHVGKILNLLSAKWFGFFSFSVAFLYSLLFFNRVGYGTILISFLSSLLTVLGLGSVYMDKLDMFEKKLPYVRLITAGGFLTLLLTSLLLQPWLMVAVLYYSLLFYVVYNNKAVTMRVVMAMLNMSFWIILGGIWYGK